MPILTKSLPKYRKHRPSGQGVVTLSGVDHYLGPHGSKTSIREYDRLIAEWLVRGRGPEPKGNAEATVSAVLDAYWRHAKTYYPMPQSKLGGELWSIRGALRFVRELYADQPADSFGPLALKVVRDRMIDRGLARSTINNNVGRIRRAFTWAASQELVAPSIPQGLGTVAGLRAGKTSAREPKSITPVCDSVVEATLDYLSLTIATMVRLQRLTGMRPGEVCLLRPCDLDRTDDVWIYRPTSHKTKYRGHDRVIFIGPKSQELLEPFLTRKPTAHCFCPRETEASRRALLHRERRTPLSCGNKPGTNRKKKPARSAGKRYSTSSYAHAIARGCEKTWPAPDGLLGDQLKAWRDEHRWSPNQLRHAAATAIRRDFGLEAAQITLGHQNANVTQVYAERDLEKGVAVARKVG